MTLTYAQQDRYNTQPIERTDIENAFRDPGVLMFGLAAVAALIVSVPETFKVMEYYHDTAVLVGFVQSWAALLVFELGALISKVATLWFPEWKGRLNLLNICLLGFVFAANCMSTYTYRAEYGAIGFAAMMPVFQGLFSWLTVARVKRVHIARLAAAEGREPSQAERLQAALDEARERQFKTMLQQLEQQMSVMTVQPAALPAPAKAIGFMPAATQQKAMPVSESHKPPITDQEATNEAWNCPNCNAALETHGQWMSAKRWNKCPNCKG